MIQFQFYGIIFCDYYSLFAARAISIIFSTHKTLTTANRIILNISTLKTKLTATNLASFCHSGYVTFFDYFLCHSLFVLAILQKLLSTGFLSQG